MTGFFPDVQLALRLRAFRQWVVACSLGMALYLLIATILIPMLFQMHWAEVQDPRLYMFWSASSSVILEVLLLGVCQWWVLRRYFAQAWRWLVLTMLCCAIALFVQWAFRYDYFTLYPLAMGLGVGVAQWLFFRGRPRATAWIVAVLVTQLVTHLIIYLLDGPANLFPFDPLSVETISGFEVLLGVALGLLKDGLICLVQGLLTGVVLAQFIASDKRRSAR